MVQLLHRPTAPDDTTDEEMSPREQLARSILVQAVTSLGQWSMMVACQTWAVYHLHQGGLFVAALTAVAGGPLLVSRLLGRLADAVGPRPVGLTATLAGSLAAAVGAFTASGPISLLILLALVSIARAASQACADTLPSWLPSRPKASKSSVWIGIAQGAPLVVGASLATTLTVTCGVRAAFAAWSVLILAGTVILLGTPTLRPDAAGPVQPLQVRRDPALRRAVVVLMVTLISYAALEPLQPIYLAQVVHAPAGWLAICQGVFGVAAVATGFVFTRLQHVVSGPRAMTCGVLAVAGGEVMVFATHSALISTIGQVAFGAGVQLLAPATRVRLLHIVPAVQHGQILGTQRSMTAVASLACLGVGPLATAVGPQLPMLVIAALLAGTAYIALPVRSAAHPTLDR
ncbi:MFS transporter [Streptacidiphilus melanogenes]|uniref:MFS transporter n=1 Tax=Streptacidiphilus melanogenes TaxID=411235 RepID=UPI0005AAA3BE|nr:MFS transporter [Streptacidiphilus melanogenes]